MAIKAIRDAVEEQKGEMAQAYECMARYQWAQAVKKFGPTLKGSFSSWAPIAHALRQYLRSLTVQTRRVDNVTCEYALDDAKVAVWAREQADAAAEGWVRKIEAKLQGVEDAELVYASGDMSQFVITATVNGHKVSLHQQRVLKASQKGLLFHQWPSRIYVDGKFTPEAKYAAAIA